MGFRIEPAFEIRESLDTGTPITWEEELNTLQAGLWEKITPETVENPDVNQLLFGFLNECATTCIEPIEKLDESKKMAFIEKAMDLLNNIKEQHESTDPFRKLYESVQRLIEIISNTFRIIVQEKIAAQISTK